MRTANWWGYGLLGLLGLVLLAGFVTLALIDPNRFRPQIAAAVLEATGRELELEGSLQWSLWPRLAVSVGPGQLRDPRASTEAPILRWSDLGFGARWLPLLRGQLELGRIRIDAPTLALRIDARGRNNWQLPQATDAAGPSRWSFAIDALELRDGALEFTDARASRRIVIDQISLTSAAWQGEGPLRLELAGRLVQPGPITEFELETTVSYAVERLELADMTAKLSLLMAKGDRLDLDIALPLAESDLSNNQHRAPTIDVRSPVGKAALTLSDVSLDLSGAEPLGAANLDLRADSLRQVLQSIGQALPTRDPAVLGAVSLATQIELQPQLLRARELRLSIDEYTFAGELRRLSADGVLEFELSAPQLDIGRYAAPDDPGAEPFKFPLDALRALRARGVLRIESATLDDVRMEGVELRLRDNADPP